jgi:RNA polymerase sigma-70 factor (ECF subfamily)
MRGRDDILAFEAARPRLLGLAYRILGSRADAEDAVQDTFLKWRAADRGGIGNPAAWLTTACTRRSLDLLRAAHRTRVDYVGAWLPEPIHTAAEGDPEADAALASSLTTAFLLVLERLTPRERAAYLLHEIFDVDYPEIAATLEMAEPACRKLVSRARANVDQARVRHVTPAETQERLLAAFEAAVAGQGTDGLAHLLADDVALSADSGGKVPALLETLHGRTAVLAFLADVSRRFWSRYARIETDINGTRGLVIRDREAVLASIGFAYDEEGRVSRIYVMRNPEKLAALAAAPLQ